MFGIMDSNLEIFYLYFGSYFEINILMKAIHYRFIFNFSFWMYHWNGKFIVIRAKI